jgi:glutamate--cysteine ligase
VDFHNLLENLNQQSFFSDLIIERGIEKESLRVTKDGHISKTGHPKTLGSSYTNPSITTDFAESLIEVVTPTYKTVDELYEKLTTIHFFINKNLKNGEMLWPLSMPPKIEDESDINIATYGKSNMAKLKHVYRKGLAIRYGKTMQCVSGIHYNFSVSDKSLKQLGYSSQNEKNKAYLNLIRNFKRLFWFVLIEFGNSPVVNKSFVAGRANDLDLLNETDLFKPYATSLRMSDIGYQSKAQKNLNFKYNDLDGFLSELRSAIMNPFPEFEDLGLKDINNEFQQISSGILQIENELYDCIRPKRAGKSGQRPYQLLKEQGIQYVEVRGIDLNPDEVVGISKEQIRILDLLLIYCLITPSRKMTDKEKIAIEQQDINVIKSGRNPNLKVLFKNKEISISAARKELVKDLEQLALSFKDHAFMNAIENIGDFKKNKFNHEISFHDYGVAKAKQNSKIIKSFANIDLESCEKEASDSLIEFDKINQEQAISFNDFIEKYNSKI